MTDYTKWPKKAIPGRQRAVYTITIPDEWLKQFRRDLLEIELEMAENASHAMIQAVRETASRLEDK